MTNIITETRICKSCENEYGASVIPVLGYEIIRGGGYCLECEGKVKDEEIKRENLAFQAKVATQRRQWRGACGIPYLYMNKDFSTFKKRNIPSIDDARDKCVDFAKNYNLLNPRGTKWLVLLSPKQWRTGKTHLACAIAHQVLNRWNGEEIACPVKFISEPEIYRKIQETYNFAPEVRQYRENEQDIIRGLIGVRLLILDDLGKEKRNDPKFVQRILFSIIDGRCNASLPMVITTNLSVKQMKMYLGAGGEDEASYKRLVEVSDFKEVSGESYGG